MQPSTYVFLCIAIAVATALIGYAVGKGKISLILQHPSQVTKDTSTFKEPYTIPSEEKEGWVTHVNEEFGYEISFPIEWNYKNNDINTMTGLNKLLGEELLHNSDSAMHATAFAQEKYLSTNLAIQVLVFKNTETNKKQMLSLIEKNDIRSNYDYTNHNKFVTYNLFSKIRMSDTFSSAVSSSGFRSGIHLSLSKFFENDNKNIYVVTFYVDYLNPLDEHGEPLELTGTEGVLSKELFETNVSNDLLEISKSFHIKQ